MADTIYDGYGRPVGHRYEAAANSRFRKLYGATQSRPEDEMLKMGDRNRIIAYLRSAVRGNPALATLLFRYVTKIGIPTPSVESGDTAYDTAKESYLKRRMRHIKWSRNTLEGQPLRTLLRVERYERLIGGECFEVYMQNGKVRIVPSELCGSPPKESDRLKGEKDGLIRKGDQVVRYRFGSRNANGQILFDDEHSTIVDARYVRHVGFSSREEEARISPPLSPAIPAIADLHDITCSKVQQIKNQSAFSMMFTKNSDPQLFAEMMTEANPNARASLAQQYTARSDYQTIVPGSIYYGEVDEDLKLIEPSLNATDFSEFELGRLTMICGVLGMPPEEAIVGYRRSNYSSSRADKLSWKDTVREVRIDEADRLSSIQSWAINRDRIFDDDIPAPPHGYDEYNVDWRYPEIEEIDQVKATTARIAKVQAGLVSGKADAAEHGVDAGERDRAIVAEAMGRAQMIKDAVGDTSPVSKEELIAQMPNAEKAATALATLAAQSGRVDDSR